MHKMHKMVKTSEKSGGKMPLSHIFSWSLLIMTLCVVPDFIAALKDVSVTIPQAVKRGSNALLTCNYDMENDTLYSVKWYKGRREFYRYTPKENPAMKVFAMTSGLNVERNLSNQSHVVLVAVPLNISGKFTCEISVEAPTFQTAMVSGEMEVVELPLEQASVTGIQPRYRIGDLVDGNCSIKFSKPAANLTWTINGIVVPPHHIKTYQIEKHEENALESVMSAVHFMVTTTHFLKGQMRLKCTASLFDIFKEEIESVIEEDRPRIMASGRSYDLNNYPYEHHGSGDGLEDHNESYLTYYSAADITSSGSPAPQIFLRTLQKRLQRIWAIIGALLRPIDSDSDKDDNVDDDDDDDDEATTITRRAAAPASLLRHVKDCAAQIMAAMRNANDRWRRDAKKMHANRAGGSGSGSGSGSGQIGGLRAAGRFVVDVDDWQSAGAPIAPIAISMSALAAIAIASLTRRHFKSGCQSASNAAPARNEQLALLLDGSDNATDSPAEADHDHANDDDNDDDDIDTDADDDGDIESDDDDVCDGEGGAVPKKRICVKSHCNCVLAVATIGATRRQRNGNNYNNNKNKNSNQNGVNATRNSRDALSAALATGGERHFATNPKDQTLLMTRVAGAAAAAHPPPSAAAC